jgi:glycogen debranching enzyme
MLIAAGLARYGFRNEAVTVASAIFEASVFFRYRLPEVFAGYRRERTGFPVEYPTACSPQAWAAGAPMLGLRIFLGLEPAGDTLKSDPLLPSWMGTLALDGIPGRWGRTNVVAEHPGAPTYNQLYSRMMVERTRLDEEDKAA